MTADLKPSDAIHKDALRMSEINGVYLQDIGRRVEIIEKELLDSLGARVRKLEDALRAQLDIEVDASAFSATSESAHETVVLERVRLYIAELDAHQQEIKRLLNAIAHMCDRDGAD